MDVPESDWPGRTAIFVERDRSRYPSMAADLAQNHTAGNMFLEIDPQQESTDEEPELLDDQVIEFLDAEHPSQAAPAAFVAGRCTTGDAAADADIKTAVIALVDSVDITERLGRRARAYVEGVMAIALLGDLDDATSRLTAQLTHPEFRSVADYLAAGYLAQMGYPTGYELLVEDLHDRDSEHVRLLALEQLTTFLPYDGQQVGKATVDVRGELRRALRDKDSDVGAEAVRLIAEARLDDAEAMLREATSRPHSKHVRAAATWTLEQLGSHD